ncbi:MAG: hypothetical protein KGR26_14040 [Cyanobacteria bacterium REEB65]|nr:hypothetical protein [Cyanobacteria bacterium REEB65]
MERREFFATNTRTGQQFCFGRFENEADAQAHFNKHFRANVGFVATGGFRASTRGEAEASGQDFFTFDGTQA